MKSLREETMPKDIGNVPDESCLYCKHFTRVAVDHGYCDLMMMLPPSKLPRDLRRTRVSFSIVSDNKKDTSIEKGANIWVGIAFCCKYFEFKGSKNSGNFRFEYFNEDEDEDE
jgi:hypothetical protein